MLYYTTLLVVLSHSYTSYLFRANVSLQLFQSRIKINTALEETRMNISETVSSALMRVNGVQEDGG
jgi:hypothetical protein